MPTPVPSAPPAPANLPPPVLLAAPPAKARFSEDPGTWAREHWPLLTAIGVVALSTIVFTMAVSTDSTPTRN